MPREKIMTLGELADYCKKNNLLTFDAKDGKNNPIACEVQTVAKFNFEDQGDDNSHPDLFYCGVKVCHTGRNVNGSSIADDVMTAAMPTLKNRPVLGYIHQLDDDSWDFYGHNATVVSDNDEGYHVEYLEKQIGSVTEDDPELVKDDKDPSKSFVVTRIAIPEEYTRAVDIIKARMEENDEINVSCEITITGMEYDTKNNVLNVKDFYFRGITILGRDDAGNKVAPGMVGSSLIPDSYSKNNNPDEKEGKAQMNKFEELLAKYSKTAEDIDFDYQNLSDEDLEKAFAEHFDKHEDAAPEGVDPRGPVENPVADEKFTLKFELSHEGIRSDLYRLLMNKDRDNGYQTEYCIVAVFDSYFVYEDYNAADNKLFAQKYTKSDDGIAVDGDPYQVYAEFLTADEKSNLDTMRANYPALEQFKADAEEKELNAKKDEVLNSEAYSVLSDNEEFNALREHKSDYSVEDLQNKADLIFAAFVKKNGEFSLKCDNEQPKQNNTIHFGHSNPDADDPYPGLF